MPVSFRLLEGNLISRRFCRVARDRPLAEQHLVGLQVLLLFCVVPLTVQTSPKTHMLFSTSSSFKSCSDSLKILGKFLYICRMAITKFEMWGCVHCFNPFPTEQKLPPSFSRQLRDVQETVGLPVVFECAINGSEPISVAWYKDGKPLKDSPNVQTSFLDNIATLNIFKTDRSLAGQYSCTATNPIGSASSGAKLILTGLWILRRMFP